MKISNKLSIVITVLVILPSITIGFVAYNEAKKGLEIQHEHQIGLVQQEVGIHSDLNLRLAHIIHEYAAKTISTNIKIAKEKFLDMCGAYANLEEDGESLVCQSGMKINDAYYPDELVREIYEIIGHSSLFSKISDTEAKKISTTVYDDMYKYGYMMEKPMFDKLFLEKELFYEFTKIKGLYKTKYCEPIYNSLGNVSGGLCVGTLETFALNSLIEQFENVEFGHDGNIYVISLIEDNNTFGNVIVGRDDLKKVNADNAGYINNIIDKKNGSLEYVRDGKEKVASFSYFEPYEWIVVAEENIPNLTSTIAGARNTIIFSALFFLILSFLAGIFSAKKITKPIVDLSKIAQLIRGGNLSRRANIKTNDEIGDLAVSFNEMTESLIETKQKTETVLESIGEGVFVIDKNRKLILFNKIAEKISGFKADEVIGSQFNKILKIKSETTNKPVSKYVKRSLEKGEVIEVEDDVVIINKHGLKRSVSFTIAPLKSGNKEVTGCVFAFRDVTMKREMDKMKNEFVSVASHQLRTPLTSIRLFSEMLANNDSKNLNNEQKEYLKYIKESINQMVKLVNDLLNIARIESGKLKISPEPINLEDLTNSVLSEARPLASSKNVKIDVKIDSGLPEIMLDRNLMRQCLHNLLVNAIRYSSNDKGRVKIVLDKSDSKHFVISVSDNGIGIPEEYKKRIFEKFYRAENAIKTVADGTGLGLYLVKMIVNQSSGEVWFESGKGKGTTFFIKLPLSGMKKKDGEQGLAFS